MTLALDGPIQYPEWPTFKFYGTGRIEAIIVLPMACRCSHRGPIKISYHATKPFMPDRVVYGKVWCRTNKTLQVQAQDERS